MRNTVQIKSNHSKERITKYLKSKKVMHSWEGNMLTYEYIQGQSPVEAPLMYVDNIRIEYKRLIEMFDTLHCDPNITNFLITDSGVVAIDFDSFKHPNEKKFEYLDFDLYFDICNSVSHKDLWEDYKDIDYDLKSAAKAYKIIKYKFNTDEVGDTVKFRLQYLLDKAIVKINSSAKCFMPFLHLNIKPKQILTSCWRCHASLGNYTTELLDEAWHNENWQEFRQQHLKWETPVGCKSCQDTEDKGIPSTRQREKPKMLEKYVETILESENLLKPKLPTDIEIRFGNLCNLQCRHCSPEYSSKWMIAAKKDPTKWIESSFSDYEIPDTAINSLKNMAPSLKHIQIAGGEPLMQPQHYDMLDCLKEYAHNITLEYASNLHYLTLGNRSVLDYWPKFKRVQLKVSIDADEETYSYIRSLGNINKLQTNWKILEDHLQESILNNQLDLYATCTVNMLNITRIDNVLKMFLKMGSKFHISFVQYPKKMDIVNLPDFLKDEVNNKIDESIEYVNTLTTEHHWRFKDKKHFNDVIRTSTDNLLKIKKYMNNPPNDSFDNFLEWMQYQDKLFNTDLIKIYPEFIKA